MTESNIDESQLSSYLALHTLYSLGSNQFPLKSLLNRFGNATNLKQAIAAKEIPGLNFSKHINAIVEKSFEWRERSAIRHMIAINNLKYPQMLQEIDHPPLVLFMEGDIDVLGSLKIALVGGRRASPLGKHQAFNFARSLAFVNAVVTSGMALGIDSAAHRGAIAGGGKTIAVLGSGLNRIYPRQNHGLFQEIINNGLAISEFPLDTPPHARNFPRRNRIISGLSMAILVIEAALKSGSLITARLGLEQGREVMAVPGNIDHDLNLGCHALIKDGAKLVDCIDDILVEIPSLQNINLMAGHENDNSERAKKSPFSDEVQHDQKSVLCLIKTQPLTVDEIMNGLCLSLQRVNTALFNLEMERRIGCENGRYYYRKNLGFNE